MRRPVWASESIHGLWSREIFSYQMSEPHFSDSLLNRSNADSFAPDFNFSPGKRVRHFECLPLLKAIYRKKEALLNVVFASRPIPAERNKLNRKVINLIAAAERNDGYA